MEGLDREPGRAAHGGIYLFETLEDAQAYVTMHTERLAGFGITGVEARFFDVNEPLSILNHAGLLPSGLATPGEPFPDPA